MKIFYAKNSNGNYLSADGKTRYVKLYGKAAYAYLRSDEGKLKRFVKISDSDNSDDIYLEIDTGSIPSFRVDERREQYVRDIKRESGICVISIYACEGHGDDDDKASGEELIADESFNLETDCSKTNIFNLSIRPSMYIICSCISIKVSKITIINYHSSEMFTYIFI